MNGSLFIYAAAAAAILTLSASGFSLALQKISHKSPSSPIRSSSSLWMFTGIIEEIGTVVSLETRDDMVMWDGSVGSGTELTLKGSIALEGAYLGCSICVSGVCLTATDLDTPGEFKVGLAPETLRRSTLGTLGSGDLVNLERGEAEGWKQSDSIICPNPPPNITSSNPLLVVSFLTFPSLSLGNRRSQLWSQCSRSH
jgi:hypothetical protein